MTLNSIVLMVSKDDWFHIHRGRHPPLCVQERRRAGIGSRQRRRVGIHHWSVSHVDGRDGGGAAADDNDRSGLRSHWKTHESCGSNDLIDGTTAITCMFLDIGKGPTETP